MIFSELDHILDATWDSVELGSTLPKHPFRRAVLGTYDGHRPQNRTVILRFSDRESRQLQIFSDNRSAKSHEIMQYPEVSLLFYDPQEGIQIRFNGQARIEAGTQALEQLWADLPPESKINYATHGIPGSPVNDPLSAFPGAEHGIPSSAFKNFSVIHFTAEEIDWLRLGVAGHFRARFVYRNNGFTGTWLVP